MNHQNESPPQVWGLPRDPIDNLLDPIVHFMHIESASGGVLLLVTALALVLANSPWSDGFLAFWKKPLGFTVGRFQMINPLQHWINDGLMAIFFFVVGLEVKREMVHGQLREFRQAALPIAAAVGGMIVPAFIYLTLQMNTAAERGWGIPMATDIAFVVGCLVILSPAFLAAYGLFLLTLAIADDIGAILIIALGYSSGLQWTPLILGCVGIVLAIFLMHVGVRNMAIYLIIMFLV